VREPSKPEAPLGEYLIEVPHSPDECAAAQFGGGVVRRAYSGCEAGTHTTWLIAELGTAEEAWSLVPRLLRDTARVVPLDRCETTERRFS
jgi:hypothetical protein